MENIWNFLYKPFFFGLGLGLLLVLFIWKSSFSANRNHKKEHKRLKEECRDLQNHLNTQLKINAEGNDSLHKKIETLKEQNENLRVNLNALQQKPGRNEVRHLHMMETAVSIMREQAPGFAPAWEQALRKAEIEQAEAEGGFKKLVRKVLPALSHSSGNNEENEDDNNNNERNK